MANQVAASLAPAQSLPGLSSTDAIAGTPIGWTQNFPAAASDMFALAPGFATPPGTAGGARAGLAADVSAAPAAAPAAPSAAAPSGGAAAVLATAGQAPSIGRLSVPPSWVAGGAPVANAAPVTVDGRGLDERRAAPRSGDGDAGRRPVGGVDRARRPGAGRAALWGKDPP